MKPFSTEEDIVKATIESDSFISSLGYQGWTRWFAKELEGFFGIPDLIIVFGKRDVRGNRLLKTFAFEMKKSDWKRALTQAFRYKAFVNYSFVIIDIFHAQPAIKNIDLFKRANIGLISIGVDGNVIFHHKPKRERPYCESLRDKLNKMLRENIFLCEKSNHLKRVSYIADFKQLPN